jgi:hypothetical protein
MIALINKKIPNCVLDDDLNYGHHASSKFFVVGQASSPAKHCGRDCNGSPPLTLSALNKLHEQIDYSRKLKILQRGGM